MMKKNMYRENNREKKAESNNSQEKFEVFTNWSVEQGDYVRKNLSQQDKYYKKKPNSFIIFLLLALGIAAFILGIVLHLKF